MYKIQNWPVYSHLYEICYWKLLLVINQNKRLKRLWVLTIDQWKSCLALIITLKTVKNKLSWLYTTCLVNKRVPAVTTRKWNKCSKNKKIIIVIQIVYRFYPSNRTQLVLKLLCKCWRIARMWIFKPPVVLKALFLSTSVAFLRIIYLILDDN